MNAIVVDDDKITQDIIEEFSSKTNLVNMVKRCNTALEASDVILNEKIDLMFLDVMMPELNGIDFIQSLNGNIPQVIMISSNENYAKDAFNLNVTDFLVKPIAYPRFLQAISKAKSIHDKQRANDTQDENIFIKVNSRLMKLNSSEIFMIEAMADYVAVHTANQRYVLHSTMKAIESKLSERDFARVHNSYIVRIDKISEIEDNTLVVNKKIIPISKTHRKNLMDKLKFI